MSTPKRPLKPAMCPGFGNAVSSEEQDGAELMDLLVGDALEAKVTDIHVDPQSDHYLLRFRVDGQLYPVAELKRETGELLVRAIEVGADIDSSGGGGRAEGSATLGPRDTPVRVARASTVQGPKISLRLLDAAQVQHDVRELGMREEDQQHLLDWAANAEGMVLCVGPTGCGKTTTCYSLLNELKDQRNILTLEDPVEYSIDGISQIALDRDDPNRPDSFSEGIRGLLRHDPDAVFLGEIRDDATVHAAVNASFSGHVLLSTMHSRDPVGAVTLLRSMGAKDYEIAASLKIILGQRILRRLCEKCKAERQAEPAEIEAAANEGVELERVWEAEGCKHCGETGHRGMTAVFELWSLQDEDQSAILAHEDEKKLRSMLRERGVRSLAASALEKAKAGEADVGEALSLR